MLFKLVHIIANHVSGLKVVVPLTLALKSDVFLGADVLENQLSTGETMTQKLKRYYQSVEYRDAAHMKEHEDGDYVKFSDILPLIEFAKKCTLPKLTTEQIEERKEWTAERSHGNSDDCFTDGQDCAEANVALDIREVLATLGITQ